MSFEQALERQEMGLAYKAITAAMGPSAQLIAFINHDKVSGDNLGLESMDIMSQHDAVLAQIDAMDEAGLESLPSLDEQMQDEGNELFQLTNEIDQLNGACDVIEAHGVSPASFGMMQATNLLAGTSLASIAVEDMAAAGPEDYQSKMALEGIMDKIKDKAAAWSVKILNFVKRIGDISFKDVSGKIVASAKVAAQKVADTTKSVGRTIKAHPYKSALIAVGGIAAAAAAIALIGQRLGQHNADIEKIIFEAQQLVNKTQSADGSARGFSMFTKFDNAGADKLLQGVNVHGVSKAQVEVNALYRTAKFHAEKAGAAHMVGDVPTVGTLQELGWTQQNIVSLSNNIITVTGKVQSAIATFVKGATTYLSSAKDVAATEALQVPGVSKRVSHTIITSLFWATYRLAKTYIGGGYHLIASVLLRLAGH
jgi:hypothetical protein